MGRVRMPGLQSEFQVSPVNLVRPRLKINSKHCLVVENLPSLHKALGPISSTAKQTNKTSLSRSLPVP